ncbi:rifamycin-inactivating phosphotransferase [Lysobacter sp. F6437]|uniref:rifamycin-inactivating phosphotransferase n=1 Tax=Lysobacter sp. F6437 TaxID=3459296 RepID=UPI00403E1009
MPSPFGFATGHINAPARNKSTGTKKGRRISRFPVSISYQPRGLRQAPCRGVQSPTLAARLRCGSRRMSTTSSKHGYVLDLQEVDRTQVAIVGGKGAHLGALSRTKGVRVPPGFCVTTAAFKRVLAATPSITALLDQLSQLAPDDREAIHALGTEIRAAIEAVAIPGDIATAIIDALTPLGDGTACAVRSSATAEDLPNASFAGQQDSYLNVVGAAQILQHVSRCWASLFTERAIAYRLRNGFDHRKVHMAVVVQRMVCPEASGVLFTADPVNGNRKVASVEACFGLGDALVSGTVNADAWKVRDDRIVEKATASEAPAPPLSDAQVVQLVQLGRRIEAHFGSPQDIEWCLDDDGFHIVQSRPITTLFPIPAADDSAPHVYISVGHQQMMTDPLRPLGVSVWQLTNAAMREAGGRMFMDAAPRLSTPAGRAGLLEMLGKSDPLIGDALRTLIERGFIPLQPDTAPASASGAPAPPAIETDPAVVDALIAKSQASIATLKRDIRTRTGPALFEFLLDDTREMRELLFDPQSHRAIMAGMEATGWLNDHLYEWLGEKNAADTLTRSAPGNITSEMGLALMDVADAIRPHPQVLAFLQQDANDDVLDALPALPGGREARDAIQRWLDSYGMRCAGEIDITATRWSERPSMLVPLLLGNIRNFEPGAATKRFEQGAQEAREKEQDLLQRLRALPDGEQKAAQTKQMIDRVRTFTGYREYPKYGLICRYFVYKQALLDEAARLVQAGVLREREDIFYLTFQELHEVARTQQADGQLITRRKQEFASYRALTPPRILTSEGECVSGMYRREDLPDGALVGLAVSAGTVEGRARVVFDMTQADLQPGNILVTPFTDPSWTPLFVSIAGLVTEVGGLMTHGAVIAREYGLPAVVGVEHATRLIRDGQRIRVHGTEGYVEILA